MITLEERLSSQDALLRVVLSGAARANRRARGQHPILAESGSGPWEHREWLDNAAHDLDSPNLDVKVIKESKRRNYVAVRHNEDWMHFLPIFGAPAPDDQTYLIHAKGKEKDTIQPLQMRFAFDGEAESQADDRLAERFGYVIRTFSAKTGKPELHFVVGTKPVSDSGDVQHDRIKWFDRYIVREDEGLSNLEEAYSVPFDPQSRV